MKKYIRKLLLPWVLLLVLIAGLPISASAEKYMEGEHADL